MYERQSRLLVLLSLTALILLQISACYHEPVMPNPNDTIPVDTIPYGTLGPCDPDTVYFQQDILPMLLVNCASAGCHNATSGADGVILDSYFNVLETADIKTNIPTSSNLYEVLVDQDPGDRMPPGGQLPPSEIALVKKWIQQGALNLKCEKDPSQCDTIGVSYAQEIVPILTSHDCIACHRAGNPVGGIRLDTHFFVDSFANTGQLYGAVAHLPGFSAMPANEPKITDCEIAVIKGWVDDGALDN